VPIFAAITVGSKSIRLSVAEAHGGRLIPLHIDREVTRLGDDVFRHNRNLSPEAVAKSLKALKRFHAAVRDYVVERTRVVVTSTLSKRNNIRIFTDWVEDATGWKVELLSAEEEGWLIHLGALAKLRRRPSTLLLINVGDISCEITFYTGGRLETISLPLGAVRLTQKFIQNDPPTRGELKRLYAYIASQLEHIPKLWLQINNKAAIATSGTAAALARAAQSLKLSAEVVTQEVAGKLVRRASKLTNRQRAYIKGIKKRAETVVAGAAVYALVLTICELKSFRYSPVSMEDGVLVEMTGAYGTYESFASLESKRKDKSLRRVALPAIRKRKSNKTKTKKRNEKNHISASSQGQLINHRLQVFLCHSSADKGGIRNLYDKLKADGIDPWLDEKKLLPGQKWELEIQKAIDATDVVVVCLSRESVNKAGFLQREIKLVLDKADEKPEGTIFLIPVLLEQCDVPLRLRQWHWVGLFEHDGYSRLLQALQARAASLRFKASKSD